MRTKPVFGSRPFGKRDARILLIAYFDPKGIETVPQSIEAWQAHSRHEIILYNMWPGRDGMLRLASDVEFDDFDGVIIHPTISYSPRTVLALDVNLKRPLEAFDGVKVLMKQDEQVLAGRLPALVREKAFDIVLTCVPPGEQEKVYPREQIGDCTLQHVLTGYVSQSMRTRAIERKRDITLSYRGSIQPLAFGRLGYEKRGIGYDMEAALRARTEIRQDISSRWEDRMGGDRWVDFLHRSSVVLGVESGANIFDFDGSVATWCAAYAERHRDDDHASKSYYMRAHEEFLHTFEGNVDYAQISPRHFEAASAGAAQLLYEGTYSGIFKPAQHFFPLRRDLGNIEAVIDFLRDDRAQREIADRSFEEIVLNPAYWYESFVKDADAAIDKQLEKKGRRKPVPPRTQTSRPSAYLLAAHEPVMDPRINWFALTLSKTHDVVVIGTYRFNEIGIGPTIEEGPDGIKIIRVERTRHDADWLETLSELRQSTPSQARGILGHLLGYMTAPKVVLEELLGAHIAAPSELARFRELCAYIINTNSALIGAINKLGAPDLVIAADFETIFAGVDCGERHDSFVIFDAHEYWPYSFTDFQHWEIEFWSALEGRLASLADMCMTVTPQLARQMGSEYGVDFHSLPNATLRIDGDMLELEASFARRLKDDHPMLVIYQGGFAQGRGLEDFIRAWPRVTSNSILSLRGPDNDYRQTLIALARSLGLEQDRVDFPEAVPESELIQAALSGDIGLVPYDPRFFGYRFCCPNKLSQYAAAGLPLLTSTTEFVANTVEENKIGYVIDISDHTAIAAKIDHLAKNRDQLVETGRRSRYFFENAFNFDVLAAPILSKIEVKSAQNKKRAGVDENALLRKTSQLRRIGATLPPETTGGHGSVGNGSRDVALAVEGASIVKSSPCHVRPNDADYLLRTPTDGGYAAILEGAPRPHFIEIDLGTVRAIDAIEIDWFGLNSFATSYAVLARISRRQDWETILDVQNGDQPTVSVSISPITARFIRIEAGRFEGPDRMLVRAFRLLAADRLHEATPAGLGVDMSPVSSIEEMLALSHSASALNFAQADVGASIVASSPFHPRPNDANYLLRSSEVDGYAAGIESENTFHFIEIDLGQPRDFDSINIEWYDHESYATAYNVLERSCSDQVWVKLFSVSDNDKLRVSHRFDKVTARFVRIETVAYRGQNRFLARGLQILNAGLPAS